MPINFKKIGKFIVENQGYILYGFGTILTAIIGARYGIGSQPAVSIPDVFEDKPVVDFAMNSKQAAVSSLTKTACKTGYAYLKTDAIKQIYNVVKDSTSDADRMYAIRSLQQIANSTGYVSVKNDAQRYITSIAKGD